jgi:hypothetical protein
MRDIFDGAPPVGAPVGDDVDLQGLEEEEEDWNHPQAVHTTTRDWTPAGGEDEYDAENPWHGYDAPRWEPPTKVNIKGGEKWVCSKHGPTCNPGICKERAHIEFERRKEKETEERLEAKRKREEKWKKNAEKKERRLAQAEGREVSHDLPPHFSRYKGAGGSGSDSEGSGSGALIGIERTSTRLDETLSQIRPLAPRVTHFHPPLCKMAQEAPKKGLCGTRERIRIQRLASLVAVGGLPPARIESRERMKHAASEVPEPLAPPPTPTTIIPLYANNPRAPRQPAPALGRPPSCQQGTMSIAPRHPHQNAPSW